MGTSIITPDVAAERLAHSGALPRPPIVTGRPALFLDMDGVLAPLAATPDAVVPNARRTRVLRLVAERLEGRVAILSGRTVAEIDRIAEASLTPVSGVHGLERRRADGSLAQAAPDAGVRIALDAFRDFAADRPGVLVEDKTVAAGLHYRGAPGAADAAEALTRRLAEQTGLSLQPGAMVFELKTPGSDKGTALTAFMREAPFAGSTPIMLGDDLTDEHGFRAAAALGGFGVLVGGPRQTDAAYGLAGVDAVLDWLEQVAEAA